MKKKVPLAALVLFTSLLPLSAQTTHPSEDVLLERLHSPDAATRRAAAETLAQIEHKNLERILPTLLLALKDPDPDVRFYVATSLAVAAYGDEANAEALGQALPSLIEALNDEDARVREIVVGAIGLVKPQPPAAATQPLLELLDDQEPRVRETAVWSLGRISPVPPEVASAILKVLKEDESSDVRGEAATILGELGDPAVVPALIEALRDSDRYVRQEAVRALREIGPHAHCALPALKKVMQNAEEDVTVRELAASAIHRIEGK